MEYVYCYILDIICRLDDSQDRDGLELIFGRIKKSKEMIHHVENSKTAQRVLPIHVIYSYWFYSNGRYYRKMG